MQQQLMEEQKEKRRSWKGKEKETKWAQKKQHGPRKPKREEKRRMKLENYTEMAGLRQEQGKEEKVTLEKREKPAQ